MINFHLVTIFPEFFTSPFQVGLADKAVKNGLMSISCHNPRDFSDNRHRHVDDRPFGGGAGMVMQIHPLYSAIRAIPKPGKILLLSAAGRPFTQALARNLANEENITLICGRYEGVDARLTQMLPIEEISIGNAVLNGGETAALAVIEAVSRLIPGYMGCQDSATEESFSENLLEYPQYTRPEVFNGHAVPEVLLTGHHERIRQWRRMMSLYNTLHVRPELLASAQLDANDAGYLANLPRLRPGANLCFCLLHYPVRLDQRKIGVSSLTNLDVHDIARISSSYGMGPFFVLTPLEDQLDLLRKILNHWTCGPGAEANPDRRLALGKVQPVAGFAQMEKLAREHYGLEPLYIAASANWPKREKTVSCRQIHELCLQKPVVILLGTARGIDFKSLPLSCQHLRPVRFLDENHLSVRSAAAIIADRVLGDFY